MPSTPPSNKTSVSLLLVKLKNLTDDIRDEHEAFAQMTTEEQHAFDQKMILLDRAVDLCRVLIKARHADTMMDQLVHLLTKKATIPPPPMPSTTTLPPNVDDHAVLEHIGSQKKPKLVSNLAENVYSRVRAFRSSQRPPPPKEGR